jgi:hypothetical protein
MDANRLVTPSKEEVTPVGSSWILDILDNDNNIID